MILIGNRRYCICGIVTHTLLDIVVGISGSFLYAAILSKVFKRRLLEVVCGSLDLNKLSGRRNIAIIATMLSRMPFPTFRCRDLMDKRKQANSFTKYSLYWSNNIKKFIHYLHIYIEVILNTSFVPAVIRYSWFHNYCWFIENIWSDQQNASIASERNY